MTNRERNLWMLLGATTVVYLAVRKQRADEQKTAAQIIAQAKQDLAPLGKPIVTS